VPGPGEVPTFTVWSRLPFRDDRFVEALAVGAHQPSRRSSRELVAGDLPPKTKLGQATLWPGGPVLTGVPLLGDGQPYGVASNEEFGYPLVFYVPGGGFLRFRKASRNGFGAANTCRGGCTTWATAWPKRPHAPRRLVRQARRSTTKYRR